MSLGDAKSLTRSGPQNKFPELSADYGNLFYCCNACNAKKRDYWPTPSQITKLFIPNPCDHVMFEHLRFNSSSVVSRTEAGEFTSERLDLNEPARLKYRESLHLAIKVFEDRLHQYSNELNSLLTRIAEGSVSGTDAADVTDDLETQINGLQANLDRWMGN